MAVQNSRKRLAALALAVAVPAAWVTPAAAAEPIGSGVTPTYDEAYYATLDYYGNLMEGSVVKSYALNGQDTITDYGVYDEVVNLTDGTRPDTEGDSTAFQFGKDAPDHFYFEGKTAAPFEALPWSLTVHYTLNGVPTEAQDLAGQQGVVEILLDIVPNQNTSDYARYNYTLEAAAMFNQDDILSLEAPGAQVQLVGNLRTVLFMALPGEECHYTIRVGSNDFSFGGMTFLMVPATLAQLDEVAEIGQRKDDIEDDYHALSGSLDGLLDAMGNMQSGLNASAAGLDQLNRARQTFSGGKDVLYNSADTAQEDLGQISKDLEPVAEQLETFSQTVTDSKTVMNGMTDTTVSLKTQLQDLEKTLKNLENGTGDVQDLLEDAADMSRSLDSLEDDLYDLEQTLTRVHNDHPGLSPIQPPDLPVQLPENVTQEIANLINGVNGQINSFNSLKNELSREGRNIADSTQTVVSDLSGLCRQLDDLTPMLSDAQDLSATLRQVSGKTQSILDSVDGLRTVLNTSEPTLQAGLQTVSGLSTTAIQTLENTQGAIGDVEDLLRRTGTDLDAGTAQSLSGISSVLRQTSKVMGETRGVKNAKNALTGIVEDTWEEFTGDKNNLLLMDANAKPVSLTDQRNPTPSSVQVLIRTQEITVDETKAEETEPESESTTFFGRIAQMFRDFGHAIAGIFQ